MASKRIIAVPALVIALLVGGVAQAHPRLVATSPRAVLSDQCAQISVSRISVFAHCRSGHKAAPLGQRGRTEHLVGRSIDEVAFGIEVIVDVGVDRCELLQRLHLPEP